jgi:hypothetical protein
LRNGAFLTRRTVDSVGESAGSPLACWLTLLAVTVGARHGTPCLWPIDCLNGV